MEAQNKGSADPGPLNRKKKLIRRKIRTEKVQRLRHTIKSFSVDHDPTKDAHQILIQAPAPIPVLALGFRLDHSFNHSCNLNPEQAPDQGMTESEESDESFVDPLTASARVTAETLSYFFELRFRLNCRTLTLRPR